MALDPSIALQFKPLQIESPNALADYAMLAKLQEGQQAQQLNALKMQEYQRGLQEQNALRTAIQRPGFDPLNLAHQTELYGAAPSLAPKYIEQALQTRESMGKIGEFEDKRRAAGLKVLGQALLVAKDDPTDEGLNRAFSVMDATGFDTKPYRAQFASVPDTKQRASLINTYIQGNPDARAALEFVQPKPEKFDLNGKIVTLDMNPNSPTYKQQIVSQQKTLTPEQAREAGLERLIVAKEFTDDAGNVTLINKFGQKINPTEAVGAAAPGAKGASVTAPTTLKGKSTPEKGRLTEAEGKATGFAMRAKEAHDKLSGLDFSPYVVATKQAMEQTPVIGGLSGAATNIGMSETNQRADQAQREFVNAVLRQESGAAISQSEFENARKQYFPQPGDKPGVIEQKRKNRETAIKSLEIAGGKGMEKVKAGAGAGAVTVDLPDGRKVSFPDAKAAAAFKEKAGL